MMRYQISSFDLLKQMLAEVAGDDFTLPWQTYPCMEWPRHRLASRYGVINSTHAAFFVHREAYRLAVGPIPNGHHACHHCDNPPCFRPIHLFSGTAFDNAQDRDAKKRRQAPVGEAHGSAKLTNDQVREIRKLYASGVKATHIAARFGIGQPTASRICLRQAWTHI